MVFIVLPLVFLITSIFIVLRIKKYFYDFYKENKCILITATFGLSIPLLFRGIFDFVSVFIDTGTLCGENCVNIISLIFWDILPIGFQISSLAFGYIRKRKMKYSLERKVSKSTNMID